MLSYNQPPFQSHIIGSTKVESFTYSNHINIHQKTVKSFGDEWNKFAQFSENDIQVAGEQYFDIVSEQILHSHSIVLDAGCGSGRWSKFIAGKVKQVEAIDPSNAIFSAANTFQNIKNVRWTQASIDNIPFEDDSFDFAICLGVLHHIPNTQLALTNIVKKIKPEGHILLYLYYALDNRGIFYKLLFRSSSLLRRMISILPSFFKHLICDLIAVFIYMPLIFLVRSIKKLISSNFYKKLPLAYYHDKSFYIIRNDALDRFGTPLEKRFSKSAISEMMKATGLIQITFSEKEPYWHVIGKKQPV